MSDKNKRLAAWAVVVIGIVIAAFLGVRYPMPAPPDDQLQGAAIRQAKFGSVQVGQDLQVIGVSALQGGAVVTGPTAAATATPGLFVNNTGAGNVSFEVQTNATPILQVQNGGAIKYGNVYPVGSSTSGKKTIFGVTSGVLQKATVVPTVSYISTVTAFGCAPQSAAFSGAWDCRAQLGASNQITLTLYENDATPVPTASYAKIQYWVAGN